MKDLSAWLMKNNEKLGARRRLLSPTFPSFRSKPLNLPFTSATMHPKVALIDGGRDIIMTSNNTGNYFS